MEMTPRETAQKEAERTYSTFLKVIKRVSLWVIILIFVVVVIFDSGVG